MDFKPKNFTVTTNSNVGTFSKFSKWFFFNQIWGNINLILLNGAEMFYDVQPTWKVLFIPLIRTIINLTSKNFQMFLKKGWKDISV